MKKEGDIQGLIKEVRHSLENMDDNIVFAYIFGSLVSGTYIPGRSDIDLGIYFVDDYSFFEISALAEEIQKSISGHPEIDIIQMQKGDLILNQQIIAKGSLVINNNPEKHDAFWLKQVSMYCDFKISRRILEEGLINPVFPKSK